ncbi:MAG: GntP family permease [Planctomycetota bacterium]|nr:GntP family permease [Planctomycetota bacterium]MDA1213638.1 GntP family permease [Planctomycetota bacterium]
MLSAGATLSILFVGMIVVIGGILGFRLHAFLALILGALIVGILTPAASIEYDAISRSAVKVVSHENDSASVTFLLASGKKKGVHEGSSFLVVRPNLDAGTVDEVARLHVTAITTEKQGDKIVERAHARVVDPSEYEWQTDDRVVTPTARLGAQASAKETIGERVAGGFGSTCANIGILIAMASIIGKCLLDSGAADRVVRSAMNFLGEKKAPVAFLSSGFLLGIPVFFDTVFYLMMPLGKALCVRTGRNYLLYILTIVAGATMAHSLVPPTPGPLFVAEQLGVDMGVMIVAGCIVGTFTAGFGYLYAVLINRMCVLPLRESADVSLAELTAAAQRDESELPPLWMAVLPIVLPVILIAGLTVLERKPLGIELPPAAMQIAETLGDKNIALVISAAIAMFMLVWKKRTTREQLAHAVQSALASGGVIILITAAGGAFGKVLQQTGVAGLIRDLPQSSPVVIIVLAFLITAAVRTAQGSATVAMITAVGILAGLSSGGQLGFHPVYLALAIGCGSKPIGWMNDSGFWVITKMSGMTEGEGLKYVTPMTTCMGFVGLAVIIVGVLLFPMA